MRPFPVLQYTSISSIVLRTRARASVARARSRAVLHKHARGVPRSEWRYDRDDFTMLNVNAKLVVMVWWWRARVEKPPDTDL